MSASSRRIDDLLLTRAIDGLSAAETRELEALLALHPRVDAEAYERAAAAICLAALGAHPAMPTRYARGSSRARRRSRPSRRARGADPL